MTRPPYWHEMTIEQKKATLAKIRWIIDVLPGALIRNGVSEERLAEVRALLEMGEEVVDRLEASEFSGRGRLQ